MADIEEDFDRQDMKLVQKELPKLSELQDVLYPLRSKWYLIGVQLDIPVDTLDAISCSSGNLDEKLVQILKEWVKQMESQGGVTWVAVVKVLRRQSIGERQMARNIARQWCKWVQMDSGTILVSSPDPPCVPIRNWRERSVW